ncbi:MAG: hypothetical protein NVSMB9_10200 [Isosphaeraceae bacterium]
MRKRIITAAVILGLGVVGVTLAQQNGEQPAHIGEAPKNQAPDKAKLRAQVAKLRAEVEVLELEHEADKEVLVALLKEERNSESESGRADQARQDVSEATMLAARLGSLEEFRKEVGDEKALQAEAEKELKQKAEHVRAEGDRKKQAFVKRAAELSEKRLELAEAEKRYNQAR